MTDGGPAFPRPSARSDEDGRSGLSLRDYLAAKAMVVVCATTPEGRAEKAYKWANAMIKERGRE